MNYVLLLGAGFSRNWGGWLAREVGDALLLAIGGDTYLQSTLNRCANFEDALSLLQGEATSSVQGKQRLMKFESAILNIFSQMNRSYQNRDHLDFDSCHGYSVGAFLAKFDSIFTLNQDSLLEMNYNMPAHTHWDAYDFPGMMRTNPTLGSHRAVFREARSPAGPVGTSDVS